MKKIFLVCAMALGSMTAFADKLDGGANLDRVNQLHPYAYGVTAEVEDGMVAITYQLNAPATAAEIVIYRDGAEVRTQPCASTAQGLGAEVVDLSEETVAGTYTFGIRVIGEATTAPRQLLGLNGTDTVATCYALYHTKGLTIDKDPFSPNFGRILTGEGMLGTPDDGYWSSTDKNGLYAFDAAFNPLPNGNNRAYTGGLTYVKKQSDGSTNVYAPCRMKISKDGRIFVSMYDDVLSPLYEVSADLQTWTPLFTQAAGTDGVRMDGENFVTGVITGFDVIGEGEDLKIITLSSKHNDGGNLNNHFISEYNIGTATSLGAPAKCDTAFVALGRPAGHYAVRDLTDIIYDGRGGYWYRAARGNHVEHNLIHVNAAGVADYDSNADTTMLKAIPGAHNGFNGGAGFILKDDYMYLGYGQAASGCGNCVCFKVNYGETATTLEYQWQYNLIGIGRALNAFDIDYAGNLYTTGNNNEKIVALMLPTDGIVTTPVNAEIEVVGSAVENVESAPVVEKLIENGQMIVIKNGVRYNVLGARL